METKSSYRLDLMLAWSYRILFLLGTLLLAYLGSGSTM